MRHSLEGRSAVITGASQGLGFAIAEAYVRAGCSVMICARSEKALANARRQLLALARPGQKILSATADVSEPADARKLAEAALSHFGDLQILVNNAGVYGPMGPIEEVDWQAWTEAVRINLMGSVLMCREVLPHMKARRYGKIVQLSGGGATGPLPGISAYAASKAAAVRFVETLAEEVREVHVDVNAIAPGALNTRLLNEVLDAGPGKVGARFYERAVKQKQEGGTPLDKGAQLAVFLGSAASDGITGKLISAVWDPWEAFPQHRADLQGTDVYTLRRIVPADRSLSWGAP